MKQVNDSNKENLKKWIIKGIIGSSNIPKWVYKIGDFYRNVRNIGLIYKYYGDFSVSMDSIVVLHETLSKHKLPFSPLNFQIIIKHTGWIMGHKEYFLSFWYGFSTGMNTVAQIKNEELKIMYQKLNSIKNELQNLDIMRNTEIEPEFMFFKKDGLTNNSKIKHEIFKDKNFNEFKEWEKSMFKQNILKIFKEMGIDEYNYSNLIKNDYFSWKMSFGSRSIQERNYEKILWFYFWDEEIYYPYTIAGEPFFSSWEYIMDFDLMKFIDHLDSKYLWKIFDNYSISINLCPTDINVQKWTDRYKIPWKSISYKYHWISEMKYFWSMHFFLNIFTREPDITPFVQWMKNNFSKIRLELTKENIDGNEWFLTKHHWFVTGSEWFGKNSNVKNIFWIMKPYIKEDKNWVKMWVDFYSNNPFKINIFEYMGKDPLWNLKWSCSSILVWTSGSGKTYFAKNYYKQNKTDQLFVLDNMGNFQQLKREDRGLVLKYWYDIASLVGKITSQLVTIEEYLFYKEPKYRDWFKKILIERIKERKKLDKNELKIYEDEINSICEKFEKGEIVKTEFSDIDSTFSFLIKSKINKIVETLYILNGMKIKVYDSKFKKFVIENVITKDEMEEFSKPFVEELFLFLWENIWKNFLIEDFKNYIVTKKTNGTLEEEKYNKIYDFIKDETDFPNFIWNIEEETITLKMETLQELLYCGKTYSTTESTRMSWIIKNYLTNKKFFLLDDFYEYLKGIKDDKKIDKDDKDAIDNLINNVNNIDEKTKSILNRSKSLIEDYLSNWRYQKIIISNEYIMNDITDLNVKNVLTSVILNSYYNYIYGVKNGIHSNPFGYSTIIIDEFHNYNSKNDEKRIIISKVTKLVRETRNNNSSVFLISQSYDDFDKTIKDNCYYKFFTEKWEWQKHKQEVMQYWGNLEKIRYLELEEWEIIQQNRISEIKEEGMEYKKRFLSVSIRKDSILTPYLLYPKYD